MRLAIRKFIIYPIMDRIFNYKQKHSNIQPMEIECAAHPATSDRLKKLDLNPSKDIVVRTMPYYEWLKYIRHECTR